jgi:hypothetical protein
LTINDVDVEPNNGVQVSRERDGGQNEMRIMSSQRLKGRPFNRVSHEITAPDSQTSKASSFMQYCMCLLILRQVF